MDRFLRSLLTSSAGDSVDTDRTLSEIARSVLADGSGGDQKSFREKAGLLALLNLLGIVEAFYGEMPAPVGSTSTALAVRDPVVDSLIRAPGSSPSQPAQMAPVAPQQAGSDAGQSLPAPGPLDEGTGKATTPEGPLSLVSGLAKMQVSMQPQASAGAASGQSMAGGAAPIAGMLSNMDPALIAGLLSAVATMARARPSSRAPARTDGQTPTEDPESETSAAEPEPSPEAAPPSPLQQILGIDPKILTLALNVLAEVMKSRASETKEKPAAESRASEQVSLRTPSVDSRPSPAGIAKRPGTRLHKPGLGIYRSPRSTIRPSPQGTTQEK